MFLCLPAVAFFRTKSFHFSSLSDSLPLPFAATFVKCSHAVRTPTLPHHVQKATKEVSFASSCQLYVPTFRNIIWLCKRLSWILNANNQSHSTLILSCFCVILPMLGISCRYQDLSQLSYSTLLNPQILSISVMSLSRFVFLKASGVFLWLFCIYLFIMQVFLLSAFLRVTVRAPQEPGVPGFWFP